MQESQSPETDESKVPETGTKPATLAELFMTEPETAEPTGDESPEGEKPAKPPKLKGLKDLAETLKTRPEDLYAIEVPMSDGKSMTLGQLKDAVAKQVDLDGQEIEIAERRARGDAELTRERTELQSLVAMLPEAARKPELIAAIRKKAEADEKAEAAKLRAALPEWADEAVRTKELAGMTAYLADFGFPPDFLGRNLNSRFMLMVRDASLRKARVDAAVEKATKLRAKTPGKSAPASAPAKREQPKPRSKGPSNPLREMFAAK